MTTHVETAALPQDSMATNKLAPVKPGERIQVIDILRGFALFGILVVNMHYFSQPFLSAVAGPDAPWWDQTAAWLISFLATSKFFTLFSFLFGLGLGIQVLRAEERGAKFFGVYVRRLGALLLFGLAHAFLLWVGDILVLYSLVGFVVALFFRKAKPRTLVIWAIILTVLQLVWPLAFGGLFWLGQTAAETSPEAAEQFELALAEQARISAEDIAIDLEVYGTGNYIEITAERVNDFVMALGTSGLTSVLTVWSMFLLGLAAAKSNIFQQLPDRLPFFRRVALICLPLGVVLNLWWAASGISLAGDSMTNLGPEFFIAVAVLNLGGPVLSMGYMAGIVLLVYETPVGRWLSVLAPVGRMGLTNYLMQSLVATTIFYGYGFALFGQVGAAMGLLITVVIYAVQIPLSHFWMGRFRYGPMEWLWRTMTYLKPQPMALAAQTPAAQPTEAQTG